MEAWKIGRPVVADSYRYVEGQDPDPRQSEKSDPVPDPHQS
jgi:hypothetical protein